MGWQEGFSWFHPRGPPGASGIQPSVFTYAHTYIDGACFSVGWVMSTQAGCFASGEKSWLCTLNQLFGYVTNWCRWPWPTAMAHGPWPMFQPWHCNQSHLQTIHGKIIGNYRKSKEHYRTIIRKLGDIIGNYRTNIVFLCLFWHLLVNY